MSYDYEDALPDILQREQIADLIDVWEQAKKLGEVAGVFQAGRLLIGGDTWTSMARVDLLVEAGRLKWVTREGAWQHHVLRCST